MLSPEQVRQYRTDGFTVCQGFLPEGEVDRFREEIEGICAGNTLANHDSTLMEMEPAQPPEGTRVRRIYQPCHHFPEFGRLSHSDRLLDCVEQLLGPDLLIQYSKINMKPADVGSVVEWHQDLSYYPLTNPGLAGGPVLSGRRQPKQRLPEDHPGPPHRALAEPHAGRPVPGTGYRTRGWLRGGVCGGRSRNRHLHALHGSPCLGSQHLVPAAANRLILSYDGPRTPWSHLRRREHDDNQRGLCPLGPHAGPGAPSQPGSL